MTTYYVAASGNDASSGRSTQLPWKSIAKVRAKILDGTTTRRDVVLFKRGDVFPGRWNVTMPGGLSDRRVLIGTYGRNPEITKNTSTPMNPPCGQPKR